MFTAFIMCMMLTQTSCLERASFLQVLEKFDLNRGLLQSSASRSASFPISHSVSRNDVNSFINYLCSTFWPSTPMLLWMQELSKLLIPQIWSPDNFFPSGHLENWEIFCCTRYSSSIRSCLSEIRHSNDPKITLEEYKSFIGRFATRIASLELENYVDVCGSCGVIEESSPLRGRVRPRR